MFFSVLLYRVLLWVHSLAYSGALLSKRPSFGDVKLSEKKSNSINLLALVPMTTTTTLAIANAAIDSLVDQFTALLPVIIPVTVGVAVLFGVIYTVRRLAHKR